MNEIRRLTGCDLRDAKQVGSFADAIQEFIHGKASAYTFERFCGNYCPRNKCLVVRISRQADVMAPHALDIPDRFIDAIVFAQGAQVMRFRNMAEATFYFHIRLIDTICRQFSMMIYLKPGVEIERCETVWRCYFIESETREKIIDLDNRNAIQYPVGRDITSKRGFYEKRIMSKL